jgi:hypothetical protein
VFNPHPRCDFESARVRQNQHPDMDDYEVVAQQLSELAETMRGLDERLAEVERVNARLEEAALTTARALGDVSRHWDAVYDAMRRTEPIDAETTSERDNAASRVRRAGGAMQPAPDH